ncbi:unnamed protein product [Didymodactylos carnosus]|uniref:Hexosyltransferase n=1 Tax=Didymodactylos carnosus TaxID=1234261 RepID=A0A815RD33_9BILA|nr:unnamed protein product [Didymodactylos carnosus]CAF1474285.1 unnamed protein product [Didymodactylos carnosus]CAF3938182.1 unnamed protein product [Didymodactylos carnosus]CAF4340972.1 unnamed protein product [Didymodactylos carnosus]
MPTVGNCRACAQQLPLPNKLVMMLRWIRSYCWSLENLNKYVLFIDDDYLLNLDNLLNYLYSIDNTKLSVHERRTFISGYLYDSSRPRRFINDRWYISYDDYPYDKYPPYLTAGSSLYTKIFRFDDIYMGLLAYSMKIKLRHNELFSSYASSTSGNDTESLISKLKSFLTVEDTEQMSKLSQTICSHGYRDENLVHLWNYLYKTNVTLNK